MGAEYEDCPDCGGTGTYRSASGRRDCYLCYGTGQVRVDSGYDDDVCEAILSASDADVLGGKLDGLADGTHYIDRNGRIQRKT